MPLTRGTLFPPQLIPDMINLVQGHSSLAKMTRQTPIAFNGNREFTFSLDTEVDVVAENAAKGHGGATIAPITIVPIKIEYGARVSDEFMYSAEEERIQLLKNFKDGFARKVARGLDLMAFHGVNPRTGIASQVIGANNFDAAVQNTVVYNALNPEDNLESAITTIQAAGGDVSGMIFSHIFTSAMKNMTSAVGGPRLYPELKLGANPGNLNGMPLDINSTVSDMNAVDRAIVGDFANSFKWGYSKEIPLEVIEYGDPDNTQSDLKGHNQVYLRAEIYLGWGILVPTRFVRIVAENPAAPLAVVLKKGSALNTTATDSVTPALTANNAYVYKINGEIPRVNTVLVDGVDGWADYTAGADIVAAEDNVIALAEVNADDKVVKGGTVTVKAADLKLA